MGDRWLLIFYLPPVKLAVGLLELSVEQYYDFIS